MTENFSEGNNFPAKDSETSEVNDNLTQFAHVNRDLELPAGNDKSACASGEIWGKGVERHSVTHSFSVPLL